MKRFGVGAIVALAVTVAVAPALPAAAARQRRATHGEIAAAAETLGSAGAWSAYVAHDHTGRVCYLAGQPQRSVAAGVRRDQPMAMVTHRPAEHIADVVSFVEGYELKPASVVTVAVGDRKFHLFTKGDSAWDKTSELDRTVVAALARGTTAVATGEAENGRRTTDIYSLDGFSKVLDLIDKACGVSRAGDVLPPRHPAVRRRHHGHAQKRHKSPTA
ncbi:MAG TPA: invasion associated locus B family protein [Stellaceae bacterium]|nr:invasion associated locus B family protein [Stellaceae bacterium]